METPKVGLANKKSIPHPTERVRVKSYKRIQDRVRLARSIDLVNTYVGRKLFAAKNVNQSGSDFAQGGPVNKQHDEIHSGYDFQQGGPVHLQSGSVGHVDRGDRSEVGSSTISINTSYSYVAANVEKLLVITSKIRGKKCNFLLDDGAMLSVISERVVHALGLQTRKLPEPISLRSFQSKTVTQVTDTVTVPWMVTDFSGKHHVMGSFDAVVGEIGKNYDVIVGLPQHSQFDIQKHYRSRRVELENAKQQRFVMECKDHSKLEQQYGVVQDIPDILPIVSMSEIEDQDESFLVYVSTCDSVGTSSGGVKNSDQQDPLLDDMQKVLDSDLTPTQKVRLVELLLGHKQQFVPPTGINRKLESYDIKHAVPERPVVQHRGRMTKQEREIVDSTIAKLMEKGWIEPCVSVWGSPMLFVKKANGELRLVIDYKMLNAQTIEDGHKLPLIDELLQKMGGKRYYSKMDLHEGYHQVPLDPISAYKSAFTTPFGDQYQWKVMPMGLKGAPNHFSRMMTRVLKPFIDKGFVVVYLDDVLIASNNFEEHVQHVSQVLEAMQRFDLRVKLKKCAFASRNVEFLGHVLNSEGVTVQQSKVKAVSDFPVPKSSGDIESFLGLVGFYRKFLPRLSHHEEMLRRKVLDWKNIPWGPEHEEAFATIKHLVCTAPVLHVADQNRAFVMHCDASEYGIGCVLQQDFGRGLQPVAFHSLKLNDGQRKYLNQKREFLAIMEGLRTWRYFLGGTGVQVTVYTDHMPNVRWNSPKFCMQDKVIAKWVVELQEDYPCVKIEHVAGKQNAVADALSRNPDFREGEDVILGSLSRRPVYHVRNNVVSSPEGEVPMEFLKIGSMHKCFPMNAVFTFGPDNSLIQKFKDAYAADRDYLAAHREYQVKDGLYFTESGKVYVPKSCVPDVLKLCHDLAGHKGREKTQEVVSARFYFPGITDAVTRYCVGCLPCQLNKTANKKAGLTQITPFNPKRWAQQSMDFIVGLPQSRGFDSIYVVCDRGSSKMVHLAPCKTSYDAEQVAQLYLDIVYRLHGLPEQIISDRDTKFMSNWYRAFMGKLGVKQTPSSVYHPETDGQTENMNKQIKFYLRLFCQKNPKDWVSFLPIVEFAINSHKNSSSNQSPFEMMYGEQPIQLKEQLLGISSNVPSCDNWSKVFRKKIDSAQECLQQAANYMKKQHDKHRKDLSLVPGDLVVLSTQKLRFPLPGGKQKLKSPYTGPLEVVAVKGSGVSIQLKVPDSWLASDTWHISYIKKYVPFEWEEQVGQVVQLANPSELVVSDNFSDLMPNLQEQIVVDVGGDKIGDSNDLAVGVPQHVELENSHPTWEVERIVKIRRKGGKVEYQLTFVGKPRSEDCWCLDLDCDVKYKGFEKALQEWNSKQGYNRPRRVHFAAVNTFFPSAGGRCPW